jgi:hypothetical protein
MQALLGDALDAWSIVVAHLCTIFAVAVFSKKYDSAAAAFSCIREFESQLKMTNAAMEQTFGDNPKILVGWKSLAKELRRVQPLRNKIAHGKLVSIVVVGGAIEYRYLPFFHFHTHKHRDTFEHLTARDLRSIAVQIRKRIAEMHEFSKSIGAIRAINSPVRIFEPGSSKVVKRAGT